MLDLISIRQMTRLLESIMKSDVWAVHQFKNFRLENPDNEIVREFRQTMEKFTEQYLQSVHFVQELAKGNFEVEAPPGNVMISPYKQLQSNLRHLVWQVQRIAEGDYGQNIQFLGSFSESLNHLIGTLRQKKQLEEELKRHQERLGLAIETSRIGFYDWDFTTNFAFFDEEWMKMLGYEHDEFEHNFATWEMLVHPDDKERVLSVFNSHLEGRIPYMEVEERMRKKDGTWLWILDRAQVYSRDKDGKPLRVMGTHLDINSRKIAEEKIRQQAEELHAQNSKLVELDKFKDAMNKKIAERNLQLAEANATKDKFFSIIAHDLRAPFNGILGLSDLLLDDFDGFDRNEIKENVQLISESAKNAFSLLENLLVWARSQTGNLSFSPEPVALEDLFLEVATLLNSTANGKGISVRCQSGVASVVADKNMLRTILRNLVGNSIKFSNRDGTIEIFSKMEKDSVVISVKDRGVGMEPDLLNRLFKINEKVCHPGTESETGTGLGLLLCKDFVEKHGGKIWAESEPDKGSVFSFMLPLSGKSEEA